jgi:hypothetical protein
MSEYDRIKAQIEDGIEGTRQAQIELQVLLHRFRNDPRAPQLRAKLAEMDLLWSDWLQIDRDFRRQYED